jgi:uncharacterized membrane protein (UPF0127 family)
MIPMIFHRRCLLVALLLLGITAGAHAQLATFGKSPLVIDTAKGPQRFTVELALTPEQQQQGLMFRRALAADAGMLFVFDTTRAASFWMRNTLIPLDMLFVAADGRIADIHERAVPLNEESIISKVPVRAVLELNGGTVARLGIKPGDVVHHAAFGNAAAS